MKAEVFDESLRQIFHHCIELNVRHCGECDEFKYEDIDGFGFCEKCCEPKTCASRACKLFKPKESGE